MKTLFKLFSLKLIGTIIGIVYMVLQVRYFGASRTIEVYFAAQSLVYLVTSLTQSGQLAEIFLPEYNNLNVLKKGLGFNALNIVINRMVAFGSIIIVIVFLFAPFFISITVPGFSIEDKEEAVLIFRILLPYLYFQLIISFFKIVMNAEKKFGRPEFLGIINTLINLVTLMVLFKPLGVWSLVISLLLGKIIEFIFYISQLNKIGYKYQLLLSSQEFNHVSFFKTMQSTVLYVGSTQFYNIVLTASISFLPVGTFAIFKYSQSLALKVRGLLIQPFLTIFFTEYSSLLSKSKSILNEFKKFISSVININVISIIGVILIGNIVIDFLWGGEKFDKSNVSLAYIFLIFNIIGVLLVSIGDIYRKMVVSHGKGKKLYFYWVFSQLISAGFSYFLIRYYKINGLYFIIPINSFLMGFVSFYIYKRTEKPVSYNFINVNNIISILLIFISVIIKYFTYSNSDYESKYYIVLLLFISIIILSLYPLINTYKFFRTKRNSN